jgi:hypothetical protein
MPGSVLLDSGQMMSQQRPIVALGHGLSASHQQGQGWRQG